MTTRQACVYIVIASGILVCTGDALQAQVSSGTGSGGAIGQGGLDITRPGKGGNATREGARSLGEGATKQGDESSGTMGSEGAIIMKPKPGGEGSSRGSGRPPDSSTPYPGPPGGSGLGSGSGSGSMGSSDGRSSSGGPGIGGDGGY